jgi:predicted Zn-dependent peptidase
MLKKPASLIVKSKKKETVKGRQKIERVILKNGLEVNFLFDKLFTTSSIQMCFKIGWRNDTNEHLGLAHLFEHLVGKRTKNYPEKSQLSKKLDELGIVTNAFTGPDSTVYFQNQINENILVSLKMLFETIYNTRFEEVDLEKEKHVVLTEAQEYLDNDDSIIWRQLIMNLYPGTTLEKFFFGTRDSMNRITMSEFIEFYKIYRNPKSSILFISSNDLKNKKKIIKNQ